jgi:hypothetical protein
MSKFPAYRKRPRFLTREYGVAIYNRMCGLSNLFFATRISPP